jgi:hypothetical protein
MEVFLVFLLHGLAALLFGVDFDIMMLGLVFKPVLRSIVCAQI